LVALTEYTDATVYIDGQTGAVSYKTGIIDALNGTAYGYYQNSLNETGWSVLEIQTTPHSEYQGNTNTMLMYAAGYLEGRLTAR